MRARAALALLALGACTAARPASDWRELGHWPEMSRALSFTLPTTAGTVNLNAVRWVVLPDPTARLVQIDVRVEAGAAEDPPGKPGLAHLVEHLMFLQRLDSAGGARSGTLIRLATVHHNAATGWDSTHYQNVARPEALATVMAIEGARFAGGCRGIDGPTFEREREVVRNELREHGDDSGSMWQQLRALAFGAAHPYARSVGGSDAALATLTLADACQFIEDYYAPSRLIVVIAGQVDADVAAGLVARHFGTIPARAPKPRAALPTASARAVRLRLDAPVEEPVIVWAFPIPARFEDLGAETDLLVEVLESALGRMFAGDERVVNATAFSMGGARRRVAIVGVQVHREADLVEVRKSVAELLTALPRVLQMMARQRLDVGSVLRRRFVMASLFGLESLEGRTHAVADHLQFARGRRFGFEVEHADQIDVVLARLLRAGRYFQDQLALEVVFRKGDAGGRASARAPLAFQGVLPEEQDAVEVDPAEAGARLQLPAPQASLPEPIRFQLANGLTVILQPAPSLLPLVTTRLVFATGSAHDPAEQAGLAELAALAFQYGTFAASSSLFEDERLGLAPREAHLDADATDEDLQVGRDHTLLTIRHVATDAPEVLHSLAFRLNAELDPAPIDRLLDHTERALTKVPRGLDSITRFAMAVAIYGAEHPYARSAGMTLRSILRIDTGDVLAFFARHYVAANATLIVAGDFDPESLEPGIRAEFGRWPAGTVTQAVPRAPRTRSGALHLGVLAADDTPEEQLEIAIGYPAPAGIDGQYAARLVLARMLSLRADAVRERLGASYGVHVWLHVAQGPGEYVIDGFADAARAGESLALLRAGIDGLRRGEGFDADFARARRLVLAELLGKSASSYALANNWSFLARFSLPSRYFDKLARLVANLSPAQVRELVAAELVPEREVVVVTGTRAAVEKTYAVAGLPAPGFMERWPPREPRPPAPRPPAPRPREPSKELLP